MSWNSTIGLWLIGGFIVYLIAANRLGNYLAIFSSSPVTYSAVAGSGAKASTSNLNLGSLFGSGGQSSGTTNVSTVANTQTAPLTGNALAMPDTSLSSSLGDWSSLNNISF